MLKSRSCLKNLLFFVVVVVVFLVLNEPLLFQIDSAIGLMIGKYGFDVCGEFN